MTLFNSICQRELPQKLLHMLGCEERNFGSFRDAWLADPETIVVLVRDGGERRQCQHWSDARGLRCSPNKECSGCRMTHCVPNLPNYLHDSDWVCDETYATIYFRVPEAHRERARELWRSTCERSKDILAGRLVAARV